LQLGSVDTHEAGPHKQATKVFTLSSILILTYP